MYPEGRGKTSLGTPARDLLAPPLIANREVGMYECNGYGVNECTATVNENGLWILQDDTVIVLCKSCEADARKDGENLSK